MESERVERRVGGTVVALIRSDITTVAVDAIVNAANHSLMGGGGVDGAIHQAGGPQILEECLQIRKRQGDCRTGEAVITNAGRLPSQYVIHTVGPIWSDGTHEEPLLLADCYRNSLTLAEEYDAKSVAFPNISTGVYRFPKDQAARIAVDTVASYLGGKASAFTEVVFVCFDQENYNLYRAEFQRL